MSESSASKSGQMKILLGHLVGCEDQDVIQWSGVYISVYFRLIFFNIMGVDVSIEMVKW